ncbi:MAG TPA: hypothetical protein VK968_14685, partial [Roseimicrobium sp.]|nr:hypothetical protein [Roseimicrobium sp.]
TQLPSVRRNDEARILYEDCAQVLVVELLKLDGGQAAMFKTLRELPHYLNWQLALLSGYNTQFKAMLDVEKWWSLISLNLENRDQYAKWTVDVTLTKLDEILRPVIAVKEGTSTVPQTRSLPLQQIIADMDYESQRNVLRQVVSRLNTLQWSVTPDLWKLVQDYQMVIETYLHRRGKQSSGNSRSVAKQAASELDLLDLLRSDFKRYGNTSNTAAAKP